MKTSKRTHLLSTACLVTWLGTGCSSEPAAESTTPERTPSTSGAAGAPASTAGAHATTPSTAAGAGGSTAAPASSGTTTSPNTQPPVTGATAGSSAGVPSAAAGGPAVGVPTAGSGTVGTGGAAAPTANADPRGKCTITSNYPDDKACLLPPAAGEGMQIHVGPTDYTNAAEVAKFIMKPGQESSECWTFHTPNDADIYYQTFELSGRAGTHHIINTMYNTALTDGGFGPCADPGTGTNGNIIDNLPGASKAYMPRGTIAPENKNVGRKIPPHAASQADMHYYNFTDHDIIREFWMNIYFAKKEDITQTAEQIRAMGGIGWSITPGTDNTYRYETDPIVGNGRVLSLLGHYHAHGKHFTASIRRAGTGKVDKVFEMYDYMDPATFEYDSVNMNPAFSAAAAGATSGLLEIKAGDVLMWDCHIVNDSDVTLTYTNEVKTGEMCNLWGSTLGITAINSVRLF